MRVAGNVKQIQEAKPLLLTIFDKVIAKFVIIVLTIDGITAAGWIVFNVITGAVATDYIRAFICSCYRLPLCNWSEYYAS